jgi:hypothetical protein
MRDEHIFAKTREKVAQEVRELRDADNAPGLVASAR